MGASLWRDVLHRDLVSMAIRSLFRSGQADAREPKELFVAGNHTVVVADYRELLSQQPTSLPVVARVVLAVPMALARPSQAPAG